MTDADGSFAAHLTWRSDIAQPLASSSLATVLIGRNIRRELGATAWNPYFV